MPSSRAKQYSSSFTIQFDLPYLIKLNEDPMSCEIVIYNIKQGETTIGADRASNDIGMIII